MKLLKIGKPLKLRFKNTNTKLMMVDNASFSDNNKIQGNINDTTFVCVV